MHTIISIYLSIYLSISVHIYFIYIYIYICRFDYQQRVLKMFPGPGYLLTEAYTGKVVCK